MKHLDVKEGSRIKLKDGCFARVIESSGKHVYALVYRKHTGLEGLDYEAKLPIGQVAEVVRR